MIVPILAKTKSEALTLAERFVNSATPPDQCGEARWVKEIFPPFPPGPTAVAA
jgi:hypothetical protein